MQALRRLEERGIYQVGRYGRWTFQGIADSICDGFVVGSSFRTAEQTAQPEVEAAPAAA